MVSNRFVFFKCRLQTNLGVTDTVAIPHSLFPIFYATLSLPMNTVETILLENIDKPNSLFVFPTDVAMFRWADHVLKLSGGGTVAMNKFIAWDTFKQNSIRSKVQGKKSVANVLRKIFVSSLIRENAELAKQGGAAIFSSLIGLKWAAEADAFVPWLTRLLPQLGVWFSKTTGLPPACFTKAGFAEAGSTSQDAEQLAVEFDGDDRDLYVLGCRYAQFLEANWLFEPAWEQPPFDDTGKECFIFFPESLSDFSEYRSILQASPHVKMVNAEASGKKNCDVFFYDNSRGEISEAALYVISLHEREKIPWDSIAVSLPDADHYEPYVLREFTNRNIPYVKRTGKPLASYPAGQFFRDLSNCVSQGFAFSALAKLLLNSHLPWKNSAEIQKLFRFGIDNNCISSWTEEIDGKEIKVNVWEDAFNEPCGFLDYSASGFFKELKRHSMDFRGARSFAELRKFYFTFREHFFDMENCLPETDLILSRCISELMLLAEIENDYPDVRPPDPFMFFVQHLDEKIYLAQQENLGVVLLPYNTAAPAPFDCHIVIGASQAALSMVYSHLDFLPMQKRKKLGLVDDDVSQVFITLHQFNSSKRTAFFCAQNSLAGYAIPHGALDAPAEPRQRYGDDPERRLQFASDLFRAEKDFYRSFAQIKNDNPGKKPILHQLQKQGFEAWVSRRKEPECSSNAPPTHESLSHIIRKRFNRNIFPGKYSVSATALNNYFQCSLKWYFENVLNIQDYQIEADLMSYFVEGNVYHAILQLFLTAVKDSKNALLMPVNVENGPELPELYRGLLLQSVNAVFGGFPCLPNDSRPAMSALSARLLTAEKNVFYSRMERFLTVFLFYFAGCKVLDSEKSYQAERDYWYLNGKIDCVLEAPPNASEDASPNAQTAAESKGIIVDFKLGKMPTQRDCKGAGERGLADFQLPMYLTLAQANSGKEIHTTLFFNILDAKPQVLFGQIYNAVKGTKTPKSNPIFKGDDSFNEIMNQFEKKAEQFAHEIKSGQFTVFESEFDRCLKCKRHRICRSVYRIDKTDWRSANDY